MAFDPSGIADANKYQATPNGNEPATALTDKPVLLNIPATCDVFSDLAPIGGGIHPAITSPTNHYSVDTASGSTLTDDIGTNDGTITNMTITEADGGDGAPFNYYLAGGVTTSTARYTTFGSALSFKTVSIWFRRLSTSSSTWILNNYTAARWIYIAYDTDTVKYYNGSSTLDTGLSCNDTEWHHLVVVESTNNNTHRIWLDGVEDDADITTNLGGIIERLGYGSSSPTSEMADVTNVQAFDFALSDIEVAALYATASPLNKKFAILSGTTQQPVEIEVWEKGPEPVSRWDFDNISGSTLTDAVGSDDGTITNMTDTAGGPFARYLAGGSIVSTIRNIDFGAGKIAFKSLSFWIKRGSSTAYTRILEDASGNSLTISISGESYQFYFWNGSVVSYPGQALSDTTNFHHVVVVEGTNNNNHWLFVDGVKASTEKSTNFGGLMRYFGRSGTVATSEVPDITNIQSFDFKLTDAQVAMLYAAGVRGNQYVANHAILHTNQPDSDDSLVLVWDETQDDNDLYVGETGDSDSTLISNTPNAEYSDATNRTYRYKIAAGTLGADSIGTRLKFTRLNYDTTVTKCYIGHGGSGGNAWDFDGNQVQVTLGGATSWSVTSNGLQSDLIDFQIDDTKDLIIAVYTAPTKTAYNSSLPSGVTEYYITGDYAADTSPSGFSTGTSFGFINEIVSVAPAKMVWPTAWKARYGMSQDPSGGADSILDSTANVLHLTPQGTMTASDLVAGTVGQGCDFDGTDDAATTSTNLGLTSYPFAILTKFEVDNLTTEQPIISGDDASNYIGLSIIVGTSGQLKIRLGDGAGMTSADYKEWYTANSLISATTEHTILILVTSFSSVTVYIDGSSVGTSTTGTGASADLTNASYNIGECLADSTFFDGKIYDLLVISAALTADEIAYLTDSLNDDLFTWGAYSGAVARLQYWDLLYENPPNTLHTQYWDEIYSLYNYIITYFDEVYGIKLQKHWDFDYSDCPQILRVFNLLYGDNPTIMRFFDLSYGDRTALIQYWDEKYGINKAIQQYWNEKYGVAGNTLLRYWDQDYNISGTNPLLKYFDEYYHIMADSVVEAKALGFYINGVKYEGPYLVSFELNKDSFKNTGEMQFNYPAPFFEAGEGVTMEIVDTDIHLYLEVTIPTKRETKNETLYIIPGESKSRILEYSNVFTEEFTNTTAQTIVETIAGRYGISVDWQIPDWPITTYNVNDQTPYEAIYGLTGDDCAKALIQSDFNGDIRIVKTMESDSNKWDTDTPTYLLDDNLHFFQTNQRGERKPGYNKYRATDQTESDETRTYLEDEEYGDFRREVRAYRVPWDGIGLRLYTSDSNANIAYVGILTEEVTEAISVINGEGESSLRKPFYGRVSHSYNDIDLGTPTITEEGVVQTPVLGQSLLTIVYTTRFYMWIVTDYDDPEIQIWVEPA